MPEKVIPAPDVPPFVTFVTSAVPMVFDNSMSYYEALCALWKWLQDDVIDVINNNASVTNDYIDLTNEYTEKFIELKNYVDTYFDNLDVQEEINHKLDEMAEDGSLQVLINNFLQPNVTWTFDTVADMQASDNLVEGGYARTLGYSSITDKCGGLYKIVSTTTDIALANDLYAQYVVENVLYSIDDFEGETPEEKLFNALDSTTRGTILAGDVEITHQYTAGNKDYRNIMIVGGTLTISVNKWFDQSGASSYTVPAFKDCTILGNNNVFFSDTSQAVGILFDGCELNNLCIYSNATASADNYVQSPYILNCNILSTENLITAYIAYDLKVCNTRIESGASTLFTFSDASGIRQGVVSDSLIEGRTNVVFSIGGAIGFTIRNCYFEANNGGLINQTSASGACYIRVENNTFIAPMSTANYAVTLASTAYNNARIQNNVCNYPNGKILCNKNIKPDRYIGANNSNYGDGINWYNNGHALSGGTYSDISLSEKDATWDSDNSVWKCPVQLEYKEAYTFVHPLYVIFAGSYGGSTPYQGYAIVRLTPRIALVGGTPTLVCDAEVIDSCNKNTAVKASDVSVTVDLNTTVYNSGDVLLTLKISGFTNFRGTYKVIDPFTTFDLITIKP